MADLLNVSEKTVYRWIEERQLPGYRLSGQYRFNRAELLEWATANKVNVSPKLLEEPQTQFFRLPELSEALQAGGIFYRLSGTDKPSVLRSVVEHLRLPPEVDREFLYQVLLSREQLESTGVGDGIAIPHVRNPVVLHLTEPSVTLCFLEKPVEYDAIDGKPVHALFTVVSPSVKAHLRLLSRLAYALRDPAMKAMIANQAGRDDILAGVRRLSAESKPSGQEAPTGSPP